MRKPLSPDVVQRAHNLLGTKRNDVYRQLIDVAGETKTDTSITSTAEQCMVIIDGMATKLAALPKTFLTTLSTTKPLSLTFVSQTGLQKLLSPSIVDTIRHCAEEYWTSIDILALKEEHFLKAMRAGNIGHKRIQEILIFRVFLENTNRFSNCSSNPLEIEEGKGGIAPVPPGEASDIERAMERDPLLVNAFKGDLAKAKKIYAQAANPKEPDKIYSWHAPEVECIAKGKAHKKYEFGCKASIASTNKSNFIVGAMAHHGRPYDGHTLKDVLAQIEKLTGVKPDEANVDLGYRGHGIEDKDIEIILAHQKRGMTQAKRRRQKRRNAIEPIIGHCKNDRKVGPRNWLQGTRGDQINTIAMAIGFNLRKILRKIFLWLWARWLFIPKTPTPQLLHA